MKPSKVRRRLSQSMAAGRIATVVRDGLEVDIIDGVVIALTNAWVVIHDLEDGVYLDAVVMLRVEDISRVLFRDDDPYHHRAMAALGESVESFDCQADVGAGDLITAASAGGEIFAVHFEGLDGEPLCIGRLVTLRKKSFDMRYVGRDGVWAPAIERWKCRDVTRIGLRGRYLDALNHFADPDMAAAT